MDAEGGPARTPIPCWCSLGRSGRQDLCDWGPQSCERAKIVEEYDPATDTWALMKPMQKPRMSIDTAVVKGKVYVIGGNGKHGGIRGGADLEKWAEGGEQSVATVDVYTPEGWPFVVSPQGKLATTWGTLKATD